MPHRLVVIEDSVAAAPASVAAMLRGNEAFTCRRVGWDEVDPHRLGREGDDLIVAVAAPPSGRLRDALERLRRAAVATPVFAVLPADADESLLRLIVPVADDFIVGPPRAAEFHHRVSRLLGSRRQDVDAVRDRLQDEMALGKIVGSDPVFVGAIEQLPRFARADATVLISGETGTGKELCARAIHHLSRRRSLPFVAVDCGAVPDQLFENELFGHARGAFTDAHRDQKGLIAMADGGTLFLDEVDALSLASQAKLLRFLQERVFRALGAERFDRADVRIIAASNRDLDASVAHGGMRADLYFRLDVLRVHLPPLRERRGDIPALAVSLLGECRASMEAPPASLSPDALERLAQHDWPGNVRELSNVVQRAAVTCDGDTILPHHLDLPVAAATAVAGSGRFRAARAAAVAAFERRYVEEMLRKHRGNVTRAAREAEQDRRAFGRVIKKYRIDRRAV